MSSEVLSMTPTGWFQVAWSDEIAAGQVHRMHYFGRELVAWRARSGRVAVMDAHCEHLGAHLGYGGSVQSGEHGEVIQCPFHGWQWDAEGRNVCIPYGPRPNRGKRMRTYPVTECNDSLYIWHDVAGRDPYFDVPDMFADFDDGLSAEDYYPQQRLYQSRVRVHPQYVLENGVDFAHFKYVHRTPIVPLFTRHDFSRPVSYVDFTITFEGDDDQTIDDVKSGVEAINGGLGAAVTKSWGMVDNRTISAITPVDETTSDIRFMVRIGRLPGDDSPKSQERARIFGQAIIEQFEADIEIWSHQRYRAKPALAPSEQESFMTFRRWAAQFYPESAAL
ncbi:MAG: Rieske 2Fe-2S domain-containing protein [Mycobacterium sp.]|nr:Rieske 2Fe-2S domain-containing protein [Mycobacterium sp.]